MTRESKSALLSFCTSTILLLAVGCSDDKNTGNSGGQLPEGSTVYAIASLTGAGTDTASSLLFAAASVTSDTTLDSSNGVEIPGTAFVFGREDEGSAYVITNQSPTLIRYDLDAKGKITKGAELSFQSFGVGQANSLRSVVFASDTKAYLLDDTTLQAIVFNPKTMTTTGKVVALSDMQSSAINVSTFFAYEPKLRNNQIVFAASYYDADFNPVANETAVAILDMTADTVTVLKDTRCGGITTSTVAPNGDIYFGSDPFFGALRRKDETFPGGCLLRLKANENALDPAFALMVKDIAGNGGGAIAADGNALYVRVFDDTAFTVTAQSSAFDILGAAAWRWWKVDLLDPTAQATKLALPAAAGDLKGFTVAGNALVPSCDANYLNSTLYTMNASGGPLKGATMHGYTSGIVKVH